MCFRPDVFAKLAVMEFAVVFVQLAADPRLRAWDNGAFAAGIHVLISVIVVCMKDVHGLITTVE